jgi:hypothetical protein
MHNDGIKPVPHEHSHSIFTPCRLKLEESFWLLSASTWGPSTVCLVPAHPLIIEQINIAVKTNGGFILPSPVSVF